MLLKKGIQNQRVEELQKRLQELGYDPGPADGVFGPRTEMAVLAFQEDKGLSVDGVVGRETWNGLFASPIPEVVSELTRPPSYSQCFDVFGDFRVAGWQEQSLVRCDLSEMADALGHIYISWLTEDDKAFVHHNWFGFVCHRLVVPHIQAAFQTVVERGLADKIRTWDGCFNVRHMRGAGQWSTHSWGIAFDLDAPWNRFGQRNFAMDEEVAACFEEAGFVWGGRWNRPDGMHFQYCTVR